MNQNMKRSFLERIFHLRQSPLKTVWEILVRTWVRLMLRLARVFPAFMRLAELPMAPYKGKRTWLPYLGDRPYVSSRAQISCPNLKLGPRCFIDDYVTIYARPKSQGEVYLAENVHIYRWSIIECGGEASLRVGANTYIQSGCIFNAFRSNIIIGRNCMIAARCSFMPYQHNFGDIDQAMREQSLTSRGDIVLEDNV